MVHDQTTEETAARSALAKMQNEASKPQYDPQPAISALADRIVSLQQSMDQLANMVIPQQQTSFTFGGLTFSLLSTARQDTMVSGENSVGREGILLQATDGERKFTIARMAWDHSKKTFVLYVGQGAAQ